MKSVVALVLTLVGCSGDGGGARAYPIPGERATRIQVEVLNASGRPGAARGGALVLRRAGIDVVYFGNSDGEALDSTRILIRRGAADVGTRIRAALKLGRISVAPDSTRLLDVTVLLGRDFPAPLDFHP